VSDLQSPSERSPPEVKLLPLALVHHLAEISLHHLTTSK
jgi:hypothetical protein